MHCWESKDELISDVHYWNSWFSIYLQYLHIQNVIRLWKSWNIFCKRFSVIFWIPLVDSVLKVTVLFIFSDCTQQKKKKKKKKIFLRILPYLVLSNYRGNYRWFQFLDQAACVTFPANALRKCMNLPVLPFCCH